MTVRTTDIPGFDELSGPEKILLAEEIWATVLSDETSVPVPESHMREIKRRMERHRDNPGALLTLEELKSRLRPQG